MSKGGKKKVLGYFCNGLGNLIEMMPALTALHIYSGNPIDMVLSTDWVDSRKEQAIDILERWPRVRKVHEATTKGEPFLVTKEGQTLAKKDYDLFYASGHNTGTAIMEWFGQYGNVWEKANWRRTRISEVEFHANEVYKMGYRGPIPPLEIPLADTPELGQKKRMRIALSNGSARSDTFMWEKKRWWGFPLLADMLRRYYDAEILFVGRGEDDMQDAMRVKKKVPELKEWVSKDLMMTQTAKILSQCDLLITSDTSVMHCGAAVGIPLVALFGPTLVSKNRPWTDKAAIIRSPIQCAPCQYHFMFQLCDNEPFRWGGEKCEAWKCMRHIYPDRVMRVVRDFWRETERMNKCEKPNS